MSYSDFDERPEERRPAREGIFDAQLIFSTPFVEAPPPLTSIVKRDGATAIFDKHKIADAIFRAAQEIGGKDRDRAENLASAVAIYLAKKLDGDIPTVDQVDDAAERVLIEMGHARTALSYARRRDRRARVRRLREGDTRALMNELREANRERMASRRETRWVRTSADTLVHWDYTRIVEALVRETGLDEGLANAIAIEVEQQIAMAEVKTLTASLIRELVGAKLIEHGLEEHHRRHMRLGVPLYDAERIIRGPSADGTALDPDATGHVLAEAVKREFALSEVFSEEAADAHVRGDLHIHDLGAVDRLHAAAQSLEYVARFGMNLHDARTFSKPPKYADTLLAQMVNSSLTLQNHFASTIAWDAVNVYFAPFVEGFADKDMHQLAQMLVYEYAYRAVVQGDRAPVTEIGIAWDVPEHLKDVEAIGPGGTATERNYGDYATTVQQFAWALFEVFREGSLRGMPFPAPIPQVHVTPAFFATDGHEAFLEHVAKTASLRGGVQFALERGTPARHEGSSWESPRTVVQRITLNLARVAYRASSEQALMGELERLVGIAARAHLQKRAFIEQLLALKGLGPLGLLTVQRDGRPYIDMQEALYLVGFSGLNECVQELTGQALHESDDAADFAQRILKRVDRLCAYWSEQLDFRCVAAHTADTELCHRFAAVDLQEFPERARKVVKCEALTGDIFYTPGARCADSAVMSPFERVRAEGAFHDIVPHDAVTIVPMPDGDTSHRSIADFVRKAYDHTLSRRIALRA